jgi:4'-phosphopantetheinyl transferase EntD
MVTDWRSAVPNEALLGEREQAFASGLPPWRRREWTAARLTARAALLRVWGRLPATLEILAASDGAPEITAPGRRPTALSLSHTGPLCACTVVEGDLPVGVDIEVVDDRNIALLPRIIGPDEPAVCSADATLLWACKEAALKACRLASARMADYQVRLACDRITVSTPHHSAPGLRAWPTWIPRAVLVSAGVNLARPRVLAFEGTTVLTLLTAQRGNPR